MTTLDDLAAEQSVEADAYAVLLPIAESLDLGGWLGSFLSRGGRTVLMASSGAEYNARSISEARRRSETAAAIQSFTKEVSEVAGARVVVAVDAESGGVQRLEHLIPPLPSSIQATGMSDAELAAVFSAHAEGARRLGVSMFLGPVVDMVTGTNAWLDGRMMIADYDRTGPVGLLYVRAAQRAGLIATAKHFPGHPDLSGHPGRDMVTLTIDQDEVLHNLQPFRTLIDGGVEAIMLGPVTVSAIDPDSPAGTSKVIVDLLRRELGFTGLIVSDDLDLESTMIGRSVPDVAVAAVAAGVQLLLIPGGTAVAEIVAGITDAVRRGTLSRSRLARAADAVRKIASLHEFPADRED
jgi:beta-N-acetylhexosaminidase